MRNRIILLLIVAAIAAGQLVAQITWKLDKAHSSVRFAVAHLVISEVSGQFKDFDATLTTGKDDLSDATLNATIKVPTIATGSDRRDAHLSSADFLNAEKFPEITFAGKTFEKTGQDTYKLSGDLTIRGVTKPVVLDVTKKGEVKVWGKTIIAFSARLEINRFDFGVKWDSKLDTGGLVAGETVKIDITYEGVKPDNS